MELSKEFEAAGKVFGTKNLAQKNRSSNFLESYFSKMSYTDMEKALYAKFGPPRGTGPFNQSFYNPNTGRTFNLHWDPNHRSGLPHLDIRKRRLPSDHYKNRPFILKNEH